MFVIGGGGGGDGAHLAAPIVNWLMGTPLGGNMRLLTATVAPDQTGKDR